MSIIFTLFVSAEHIIHSIVHFSNAVILCLQLALYKQVMVTQLDAMTVDLKFLIGR
jgi:hypothetical protein